MNITEVRYAVIAVIVSVLLLLGLYFGVLFALHDFDPEFLAIDACLDDGGTWDYDTRTCRRE